jgi:hypothetical protein
MSAPRREEKRARESRRQFHDHGDFGYVGEKERKVGGYGPNRMGNSVDAMLTSDCLPSNMETIRYAMKNEPAMPVDRFDLPRGPGAAQSGPKNRPQSAQGDYRRVKDAEVRPGRERKDRY